MKNLILISGKARHGKDQLSQYIIEQFKLENKKVIQFAYGDYLKEIAERYFGWNGEKDEQGRQLIQYIGTDLVRKKLNMPNFWVNHIVNLVRIIEDLYDYVIITDCRFPNEIKIPKDIFKDNAISIRVHRNDFKSPLTREQQSHLSEIALDDYAFDYYIDNNSTLQDLKYKTSQFINDLKTNNIICNKSFDEKISKNTKVKVVKINSDKAKHLEKYIGEIGEVITNHVVFKNKRRYKVLFNFGEEVETAYFRDGELEVMI